MAETTTYQCPNCNGRLRFDGDLGKLKCDFCESEFTPEEVEQIYAERQQTSDAAAKKEEERQGRTAEETEAQVAAAPVQGEDPIDTYLRNAHWDGLDQENLRSFNCSSCGAQLLVDQVTAVTSCPYCGNNAVVPGQLSDMLKPDFVIPFKLDKDDAIAALKRYYQGKKFLPKDFVEANHIAEVQGVYVPFWLYSGSASSDVTFNARNVRTWSDNDNNYTETDHYKVHRAGDMEFHRVPVDGSTKMPDAHMDAIEPFDYNEMVPFSVGYLPGYLTDRYDQGVKTCEERAGKRVEATCVDTMRETVTGYMEVDVDQSSASLNLNDVSYALLPVWMLHTEWGGEDYLFAMNGQTGRLVGDLPIDRTKVTLWSVGICLPLVVILFLVVNFTMGFGF